MFPDTAIEAAMKALPEPFRARPARAEEFRCRGFGPPIDVYYTAMEDLIAKKIPEIIASRTEPLPSRLPSGRRQPSKLLANVQTRTTTTRRARSTS